MKMELRRRALDKVYKRRDRIDMPDFQREKVWSVQQKRLLIDTILRKWHLPKFYFRQIDEVSSECVDGQQRLAAIFEFYDGHLQLDAKMGQAYGGRTYKDLRPSFSDAFDDFDIDIEEISDATDRELEDLFVRLQLGTPLTTAEKLNAVGGEARAFAKWMSDQHFFEHGIAIRDTRYAHFDIAAKWLFVEARGIQPQMRFAQLEPFLKDGSAFSASGPAARRIKAALNYLKRAIPTRSEVLRNRASVLSVCMLAAKVVDAGISNSTAAQFGAFIQDFFTKLSVEIEKGPKGRDTDLRGYQEAISYGSTGGESIRTRLKVLSKRLAAFDSDFAALLGSATSTGTEHALADEISALIYAVNERSAQKDGVDTFKMTNKSARSIKRLANACDDAKRFGELVDDLYFLVYEGTGDCKRLPTPPPQYSMDVKFLRTQFRHDLDHGDESDATRKRRRGGNVLRKYLGVASLDDATAAHYHTGQLRLLQGLRDMLTALP